MTVYSWPLQQVTPAPGADIATETTQLLNKGYLTTIATKITAIEAWDKNSGAAGAATLRTVLATRHEAVATPLSARLSDGTDFIPAIAVATAQTTFATAAKSLHTIAQAFGWDGSAHREILLDSGGRVTLSTRHETVTTPLATRLSDGTDFISTEAIAAAQKTVATATKCLDTVSFMLGWDTATHREILLDTLGAMRISAADLIAVKPEYSSAFVPVLRDFSSTGLTANVWSEYIASTSAKATLIQYFNEAGFPVELGFGAGGAEVSKVILAEAGEIMLLIPAGTRLALRCTSNVAAGNFWISALV